MKTTNKCKAKGICPEQIASVEWGRPGPDVAELLVPIGAGQLLLERVNNLSLGEWGHGLMAASNFATRNLG